ncbi:hypothetical protein [Derxia gummosa]|uniref:Uncharacterized protein n=1 Tax=Derxia gummosa DSM 723 TaxID=1121388 RepID=A0A8B6XCI5_9BURK|nr:hypothetical protein [Derxia gummosa]
MNPHLFQTLLSACRKQCECSSGRKLLRKNLECDVTPEMFAACTQALNEWTEKAKKELPPGVDRQAVDLDRYSDLLHAFRKRAATEAGIQSLRKELQDADATCRMAIEQAIATAPPRRGS